MYTASITTGNSWEKIQSLKIKLGSNWDGEWFDDELNRVLYATDASIYRELPAALVIPKNEVAIKQLVAAAAQINVPLIPRGAGTSLAGQVVGNGVVVDCSKHFTNILEINPTEKWVRLQPGVIRDDLNNALEPFGLMLGPETSTTNRCTIGGMLGNNSCGSRSLIFGSMRDHILGCRLITRFGDLVDIDPSKHNPGQEDLLKGLDKILGDKALQEKIRSNYPKSSIKRRNHGYALDILLNSQRYNSAGTEACNIAQLLCGSEGTLGFISEVKLSLVEILPPHQSLLLLECESIDQSLRANIEALKYKPSACELMDHFIISNARKLRSQKDNAALIEGEPQAILVVEFAEKTQESLREKLTALQKMLSQLGLCTNSTVIPKEAMHKIWDLRKAGLGILSTVKGDAKPIAFVEDTAVEASDLPEFIRQFNQLLHSKGLSAVHYAHAATGELHLRPVIDLKSQEGKTQLRQVAQETAELVKKYQGSVSGEHGDGRLRGSFIPFMYGEEIYQAFQAVKSLFDPAGIFNPGKIVAVPPIDSDLRYHKAYRNFSYKTAYAFEESGGFQAAVEMCNGSGDCVKTSLTAGTMCPSFQATKKEKDSTRGRANVLREVLAKGPYAIKNSPELEEAMQLCISCKACKKECPSNVDMAKMKSELLHLKHKKRFNPKAFLIARLPSLLMVLAKYPVLSNFLLGIGEGLAKKCLGIAPERAIPKLYSMPKLPKHYKTNEADIFLFVDEFTQFERPWIVAQAISLLEHSGSTVAILPINNSYRSACSVGQLDFVKAGINHWHKKLQKLKINQIVCLEPSSLSMLLDEFTDLCSGSQREFFESLKTKCSSIERYLWQHSSGIRIQSNPINEVLIHAHCHQKAMEDPFALEKLLKKLGVDQVSTLDSGCCGMAGFFGFEKANFAISKKIGEVKLFPKIKSKPGATVVAAGISCQQQLMGIINTRALHPVEFLHQLIFPINS
ncbi:MAG: FAD-binding and (Fe-S)-binding domain-containing protein [Luteibaculum sp.]